MGQACELIRQACEGLWHAHQQGVLHHDVKPSNLMLDQTGNIKLLDLGIADPNLTAEVSGQLEHEPLMASFRGTLEYTAPERLRADGGLQGDARSDQYSLGATLYFLLTGQPPLAKRQGDTRQELMQAQLSKMPSPPLAEPSGDDAANSSRANALVLRMLSKLPEERFADLGEVLQAIAPLAEGFAVESLLDDVRVCSADQADWADQPSLLDTSNSLSPPSEIRSPRSPAFSRGQRPTLATGAIFVGLVLVAAAVIASLFRPSTADQRFAGPPPANQNQDLPESISPLGLDEILSDLSPPQPLDSLPPSLHWVTTGPRGAVTSLAWAPDGTQLAVYSGDMHLRVYHYLDDQLAYQYSLWFPYPDQAAVRWSLDGDYLSIAGRSVTDSRLRVLDAQTGARYREFEWPSVDFTGYDWLTDSDTLVLASVSGLALWDIHTGQSWVVLPNYSPSTICSLPVDHRIERDMAREAVVDQAASAATGDGVIQGNTLDERQWIAFTDEGRGRIIIGSFDPRSEFAFEEHLQADYPPVGQPIAIKAYEHGHAVACAFTRSVELISIDGTAPGRIPSRSGPASSVDRLATHPERWVLGGLGFWSIATPQADSGWKFESAHRIGSAVHSIHQLAVHPGGQCIAIGTHGKVTLVDGTGERTLTAIGGGTVVDVVAGSQQFALCDQDGAVLFTTSSGHHLRTIANQSGYSAVGLAVAGDWSVLAVTYGEAAAADVFDVLPDVWSRQRLTTDSTEAYAARWSAATGVTATDRAGPEMIAIGSRYGRTTELLQWQPAETVWKNRGTRVLNPRLAVIDSSRQQLAIANYRQEVEIQSLGDGASHLYRPQLSPGILRDITWTTDGRRLILACDRGKYLELVCMQVADGKIVWRHRRSHQSQPRLNMQGLLDDGRLLYSVGTVLVVVDVATGEGLQEISVPGHYGSDLRVVAWPGSETFVTLTHADQGGTAVLWDAHQWTPRAVLVTAGVNQWVTISADGQILDASADATEAMRNPLASTDNAPISQPAE